jgi:hypothetical protein
MDEHLTKTTKINIGSLPQDSLELKGRLYLTGIENRLEDSLKFISDSYTQKNWLDDCLKFVNWHMADGVKSTIDQLNTIGFYPIVEASLELDHSLKHALFGSYKAAFADIRRALELAVLSVYFVSSESRSEKAKEWIKSKTDTPFMSRMLKELIKSDRFLELHTQCNWEADVKELYYGISDYSHNKGTEKSYNHLNRINFHTGGSHLPNIYTETLSIFLDHYIKTVRQIATILALYNPVLLIGLNMEEKFGFNDPFSGYYGDYESGLLTKLIPDNYKPFFEHLKTTDEEVIGTKKWIKSLPDITEEEIEEQIKKQDEFLNSMKKKDN